MHTGDGVGFECVLSLETVLIRINDGMPNFRPWLDVDLVSSFFTDESVLDLDNDGTVGARSTLALVSSVAELPLLRFSAVGSFVDKLLLILEAADAAAAEEAVAERRSSGVENMRRFIFTMGSSASCVA